MRRRLSVLFGLLFVAGCESHAPAPDGRTHSSSALGVAVTPGTPQAAALARLEQETGVRWEASLDPRFGTAVNLEGRTEPLVIPGRSTHQQAAIGFLAAHPELFAVQPSQLTVSRQRNDELG